MCTVACLDLRTSFPVVSQRASEISESQPFQPAAVNIYLGEQE